MEFEYNITVRGYEIDSYNHVNNSVYLNYLEQARWEIYKKQNLSEYFEKNKLFLVVTDINIHYGKAAKIFDELIIKTKIEKDDFFLYFKHKIYNKKTNLKITQAKVKTILIDDKNMPVDFPDIILNQLL